MERRTFLKGAAVAGAAVMAGPLLTGGTLAQEKSESEIQMEQAAMEIEQAYKTDPVAMRAPGTAQGNRQRQEGDHPDHLHAGRSGN